jgi:RNA polymerase sigma-70 factor, ECF subfamily
LQFDYLKSAVSGVDKDIVLEELMDAYGRDVWNYAFFLTGRPELAEDIAQDVFVKVYERIDTFRGQSAVKTWLLAITRNAARDALRSAWLRRVTLFSGAFDMLSSRSAEQEAIEGLVTEQIWLDVMALPRKLREVLLLAAHHGLAIKEIAGMLGISEGTVKSRLHRARTAMQRKLSERGASEGDDGHSWGSQSRSGKGSGNIGSGSGGGSQGSQGEAAT